ncbi:hypothetical protein I305_06375 [Cryptococcus gattii E566]|uniref:Zn(2)-C6 fungal-type domain-containing protein n=1 Tax=Cryptococcus gattii EJB2 TaxID=1296103 RepID=A0ABR5BMJ1_9TREE|nr:hypothetical protein I306_06150 [Cryptococcus gattii EJB2]KIY31266.1 hypothetical protein I305_06375 [Cryptococcus gattii E566]KJE02296.1 hypothetical protein I311_04066 [Cryptococcus gattii NT-10]
MDWTDFHFSQWSKQQDSGAVPPTDGWDPNDVLNTELFGLSSTPMASSSSEHAPLPSSSNGHSLNKSESNGSDDALFHSYILQSMGMLGGIGEIGQLLETERVFSGEGTLPASAIHPPEHAVVADGSTSSQKPAPGPGEPPLRRGMACMFCRRRKLRCSGEKPTCASCIRHNQSCEYRTTEKLSNVRSRKNETDEGNYNLNYHYSRLPVTDYSASLPPVTGFLPYAFKQHEQPGFDPGPSNTSSDPSFSGLFSSASEIFPASQTIEPCPSSFTNTSHPSQSSSPGSIRFFPEMEEEDPVERLTERFGEFLFNQKESPDTSQAQDTSTQNEGSEWQKKRKTGKDGRWAADGKATSENARRAGVLQTTVESDGLSDENRNALLEFFLSSPHKFFEMNIPRFRYRMSLTDKRRPALALLNAMYLWAARLSDMPNSAAVERHFFTKACQHLGSAAASDDQLLDTIRAAALLSIYMYTRSRYHEGWLVAGVAARLVLSSGIHQIPSLTFQPSLSEDPLLRNRVHLLSPPRDPTELGERVQTFWIVFIVERSGALATGFPSTIRDEDILTPLAKPLSDISSQNVTLHDDVTITDMYQDADDSNPKAMYTHHTQWIRALIILERASKLAFLKPSRDSEYAKAWTEYTNARRSSSSQTSPPSPPPQHLNQPKHTNPREYRECLSALNNLRKSLGVDGISPLERKRMADAIGAQLDIPHNIIHLHHNMAATELLLHDINCTDVDNSEAMKAARQSVDLIRCLPQTTYYPFDGEISVAWCIIAKCMIKELGRLKRKGDDDACELISEDVDVMINELHHVGDALHMSRTQATAMEELKHLALSSRKEPTLPAGTS